MVYEFSIPIDMIVIEDSQQFGMEWLREALAVGTTVEAGRWREIYEAVMAGKSMDPITLNHDFVLLDGYHRVHIYRYLGKERIDAQVIVRGENQSFADKIRDDSDIVAKTAIRDDLNRIMEPMQDQ